MSGSVLAAIVIPVVVGVALAVWITAVMYAARHPGGQDRDRKPRWDVSGGVFRGDPRQQIPHRDATPSQVADREGRPAG